MATGGQPSTQPGHPTTSSSDCPLCGSLCLGPVILPCRDVICRRCLHDMLQEWAPRVACRQCGQHLDLPRDRKVTVSELVQQMGTDPVLDNLVHQELNKATDVRCLHCPNNEAARVCLDCQEYYCDVCSGIHCRSRFTRDHILHSLSQALVNSPSASHPIPTVSPASSFVVSPSLLDSIRNLPDSPSSDTSRGVNEWNEWVTRQMSLLQEASRERLKVKTILQDILSLGQDLLNGVLADEQILNAYQHYLPRFDVIRRIDAGTYVIRATGSDVSTEVKTESLEGRLCGVRQGRHCLELKALEMIKTQLDQQLHRADKRTQDLTVTNKRTLDLTATDQGTLDLLTIPAGPTISSPTHTPTSTQLPPATPATTHTFTPTIEVMTATPQRLFTTSPPTTADDRGKPMITSIVCLPDDTLIMADSKNDKVKVMGLAPPHTLSAFLSIPEKPWRLALLSDGLVAVTTEQPVIYLIKVTDTVTASSRIRTFRKYDGIAGQSDGDMLVSCSKDGAGPAAVHVLSRRGHVVRIVTDSTRLTGLKSPEYICDGGDNHVLVADFWKHLVHRVEVSSGHVTHTYDHTDLRYPTQVCADRAGVIYIASRGGDSGGRGGGGCVLVRNRGDQWRRLLTSDLRDQGYIIPRGLCLTRAGRLVVTWLDRSYGDSVVVCYDLM